MTSTAFASALALAAMTVGTGALAETWNMPTAYPADNYHTENAQAFADEVKECSGGELEIVLHPGGSLFKGDEIKRAVQLGEAEIGERLLSAHANEARSSPTIPCLSSPPPSRRRKSCAPPPCRR